MPRSEPLRIVRNLRQVRCSNCTLVHEFITRPTEGMRCDTPVAYPQSVANKVAELQAGSLRAVESIETGTQVVIDERYRSLPKGEEPNLAHFTISSRLA